MLTQIDLPALMDTIGEATEHQVPYRSKIWLSDVINTQIAQHALTEARQGKVSPNDDSLPPPPEQYPKTDVAGNALHTGDKVVVSGWRGRLEMMVVEKCCPVLVRCKPPTSNYGGSTYREEQVMKL